MEDRKYIIFKLSDQMFGVPIESVKEIVAVGKTYKIPGTPDYVKGMTSIRDKVYPVIDLRVRIGLDNGSPSKDPKIVISGDNKFGFLVDEVLEIQKINASDFNQITTIGLNLDRVFFTGIIKRGSDIIASLDLSKIWTNESEEQYGAVLSAAR